MNGSASLPWLRTIARPFWLVWASSTVSQLGDGVRSVALPLLAAAVTRDPLAVSGVFLLTYLPWLVLALPVGAFVDRHSARRVMIAADVARGGVLSVLVLALAADRMSYPLVAGAALALGVGETFFDAAANALLPRLVPDDELARANGRLLSGVAIGQDVAGPALGGLAYASSAALPFVADAASFAVSAALLTAAPPEPASAAAPTNLRADMAEGVRWFARAPLMRVLAAYLGLLALAQGMTDSILVLHGLENLGLTGAGFGVFMAVASLGNVAGGLVAEAVWRRAPTQGVVLGGGLASALAFALVAAVRHPAAAAAALALEAVAVSCIVVVTLTLRQQATPDHLRGRVTNLFRTVLYGSGPLGALAAGLLARPFGAATVFWAAAALQTAAVLAAAGPLTRCLRADAGRQLKAKAALEPASLVIG